MADELLDSLVDAPDPETPATEPAATEAPAESTTEPVQTEAVAVPATPEPAPTPVATAPTPAKEPERVPLAVLLEERRTNEARFKALQEELAKAKEAKAAPAETPAADIDYTADPKGYVDLKVSKALHELEQLKKEGTETLQRTHSDVADLRLSAQIDAAEANFATEAPDYQDAIAHMRNVRVKQMQLINPGATQEQLVSFLSQEEKQMAAAELAAGRNPYKLVYEVAKTFGWASQPTKQPASATPISTAVKPNGTLPPDLTLNKTGGASPETAADADEEEDILERAFSERGFRKRA